MSRLIDADSLASKIENHPWTEDRSNQIINIIDDEPTAFDVDKVVEILDEDAQMLYSLQAFEPIKAWKHDYLIPIVKAGGSKTLLDVMQEGVSKNE